MGLLEKVKGTSSIASPCHAAPPDTQPFYQHGRTEILSGGLAEITGPGTAAAVAVEGIVFELQNGALACDSAS